MNTSLIERWCPASFRGRCVAIFAGTLLAGAAAGTLTVTAMDRQGPALALPAAAEGSSVAAPRLASLSPAEQGTNWATQAFPVGLRHCPDADPAFVAACQAQMTALANTPAPVWQTAPAKTASPRWARDERSVDAFADDSRVRVWRGDDQDLVPVERDRAMPQYACYGCDRDDRPQNQDVADDDEESGYADAGPTPRQAMAAVWQRMAQLDQER